MLAAWKLVSRDPRRTWSVVSTTSPKDLAERFGVLEAVAAQLYRYRVERLLWKEWLSKNVSTVAGLSSAEKEDYPWEVYEGPEWTLLNVAFAKVG